MKKIPKYKVGLALSGGGVKGFAHAGAFKALEEYGIKPQIISGTSAGSVAGVLYSAGYKPQEIYKMFFSKGFNNFVALTLPVSGFFNPSKFVQFLCKQIKYENLEDLPIPVRIVATDLDHGKSIIFTKGRLAERVMASSTIPVVFVPTEIDGVHYVDGGIFCNFPVSAIREDCEKVIGVNVSPLVPTEYKQTLVGIAERSYNFMFRANTIEECKKCDIIIEVADALKYSSLDLSKVEDIYRLGYESMVRELERNKDILDDFR